MIMARRLRTGPAVPARPVDWSQWVGGEWFVLQQGRDFDQDARRASRAARQWATNHGFNCNAVLDKDNEKFSLRLTKIRARRKASA